MTRKEKQEIRNAARRKLFRWSDDGITIYAKPCGCPGSFHALTKGVTSFYYSTSFLAAQPEDLTECKECRAVWTYFDFERCREWL